MYDNYIVTIHAGDAPDTAVEAVPFADADNRVQAAQLGLAKNRERGGIAASATPLHVSVIDPRVARCTRFVATPPRDGWDLSTPQGTRIAS